MFASVVHWAKMDQMLASASHCTTVSKYSVPFLFPQEPWDILVPYGLQDPAGGLFIPHPLTVVLALWLVLAIDNVWAEVLVANVRFHGLSFPLR